MTPAELTARGVRVISLQIQAHDAILLRHGEGFETSPAPNRNGSHEDHVMAFKALPSPEVLRQLLRYEPDTGKLFWLERPVGYFTTMDPRGPAWACRVWNARYADKEAFCFTDGNGYHVGKIDGVKYLAHRIIWAMMHGSAPDMLDHKNRDPSDNRLSNLRPCSQSQNSQNYRRQRVGSSPYRGVSWVGRDRVWRASIGVSMRKIGLGDFRSPEDAARAYDAAATQHFGEFAILNFPSAALTTGETDD